ncbi:hypothetical protein [Helicobacter sp. 23-1045]
MKILLTFLQSKFNAGSGVTAFFIALLAISIAIVLSFDTAPHAKQIAPQKLPKIEIFNFTAYEIDKTALLTELIAKNAKQFELPDKSTQEEIFEMTLKRNGTSFDTLYAPSARKVGDVIYFDDGVKNLRDGYEAHSDIAVYDLRSKVLKGRDNFYIKSAFEDIKGLHFNYENGVIQAQNIHAKIKLRGAK